MMTSTSAPPKCLSRRIFYSVAISTLMFTTFCQGMYERERLEKYHARNYTWPPKYNPSTEGWKKLMDRRFTQMAHTSKEERYEGYVQVSPSAYVVPNFTETGWGLTRAPEELVEELRTAVREGFSKARLEGKLDVVEVEKPPLFIDRPDLMNKIVRELKPMHEKWSGVPLVGNNAYGFRLYQNQSALHMHVDKSTTHIISSILHVDHSDDSEPWPILIEDYQGNTNEVILESGDMLFYESAKCLHGRPKKFVGSWYTSVFTHYNPVGWKSSTEKLEQHYGVPPHWNATPEEGKPFPYESLGDYTYDEKDQLRMVGTGMIEPECPDNWCALNATVKWYGPAKMDNVITAGNTFMLSDEL